MSARIINISPSKFDEDCMVITLRLMPGALEKWMGKKEQLVTYKGQGNDWYRYPCYTPASGKVAKLLKSINRGWEYRHLQYQYKQKIKKAS